MAIRFLAFLRATRGSVGIEYALIAALTTIPLILAIALLGVEYDRVYQYVIDNISAVLR